MAGGPEAIAMVQAALIGQTYGLLSPVKCVVSIKIKPRLISPNIEK